MNKKLTKIDIAFMFVKIGVFKSFLEYIEAIMDGSVSVRLMKEPYDSIAFRPDGVRRKVWMQELGDRAYMLGREETSGGAVRLYVWPYLDEVDRFAVAYNRLRRLDRASERGLHSREAEYAYVSELETYARALEPSTTYEIEVIRRERRHSAVSEETASPDEPASQEEPSPSEEAASHSEEAASAPEYKWVF